jgi:hypothetical protein
MKTKILALNKALFDGTIDEVQYKAASDRLLCRLDWQKQIQFRNMLYV